MAKTNRSALTAASSRALPDPYLLRSHERCLTERQSIGLGSDLVGQRGYGKNANRQPSGSQWHGFGDASSWS